MRRLWLLLFISACSAPMPPVEGGPCYGDNLGRCDPSQPRLLECVSETWTVHADCHGPNGCSANAETANCDTSGNSIGARCPPSSEGKVRCDPDGGINILRCVSGVLGVIHTCDAPTRCGFDDAGLTCID